MLALIPTVILLLAAAAIFIIQRLRPSVGYSWLIAMVSSLFSAGWMIFLRWRLPQQVAINDWLPFSTFTDSPIFGLDGNSWPYSFALAAVALSVIFTASARLQYNVTPYAWAGVLSLSAVGILAVLSGNMLTLVLAWSLVDLIELVILQANSGDRSLGIQTVIGFSARVSGTMLVMAASLVNTSQQLPPTFSSLPPTSALLLLLASGLRLGVLPLHLPSMQGFIPRRGLGTTLRMVAAASALMVLARLPAQSVPSQWLGPLLTLTSLASLYGAATWASAENEIEGRPYWLIALSGLAVSSAIQGQSRASLAWGMTLILAGSVLFLFSARSRRILFLPVLALVGMSGIAFTPIASGWAGLFSAPFSLYSVLLLLSHVFLIAGYARFIFQSGDDLSRMERWIQAAYPLGLAVLVLAQFFTGLIGWPGAFGIGVVWAAPLSVMLALTGWQAVLLWQRRTGAEDPLSRWYVVTARNTGAFISALFSLSWLYRFLWWFYRRLLQAIEFITQVYEGAGGVLWAFVLLALLISIIQSGLAQ